MWQLSQPGTMEVQDRMRMEMLQNPGAAVDELVYLDAVVKEGLRCFPPIPMSLPRYVPEGGDQSLAIMSLSGILFAPH
jgi:hypothetical protein